MILEMLVGAALGQDVTSTCREFGGTITCQHSAMPSAADGAEQARLGAMAAAESAERRSEARRAQVGYYQECAGRMWLLAGCSRSQHDEAVAAIAGRARAVALRSAVTTALAAGDCPGAVRLALDGGDMALAREAREICR